MKVLKFLGGLLKGGVPNFQPLVNACYEEFMSGFLLLSIIGALLAVLILVAINGIEKLKPKRTITKVFNGINFIYLPLLFAVAFGGYGALSFTKSYVVKQVPSNIIPATQLAFPSFQFFVKSNWKKIARKKESLDDVMVDFSKFVTIMPIDSSFLELKKAEIANQEIPKIIANGLEAVIAQSKLDNPSLEGSDIAIVKQISPIQLSTPFWAGVEKILIEKNNANFIGKYAKWSFMVLLFSSLLVIELLVVFIKK